MDDPTVGPAARAWAEALASWAIPQQILDAAPEDPWVHPVSRFAARADDALARRDGVSFELACDALREARADRGTATVLDVGAGSGAAGLPLVAAGEADRLVAVDPSDAMLVALAARAAALGADVATVTGRWPAADVVAAAGVADVVVCHHVLSDVADIGPFVDALTAAARVAVVVELPPRHPLSWMTPLWQRFHGLDRPTSPTSDGDLPAVLAERGIVALRVVEWQRTDAAPEDPDERAALVTRRLCLPQSRRAEVAAALATVDPVGPRDTVTLVWRPPRTLGA